MRALDWPLMHNNVTRQDLNCLIAYLSQDDPRLTNGPLVRQFEEEFAHWLGVKHAVMVNSGSSANLITMAALKELFGPQQIYLSPITWSSDVMSILHAGHRPVFLDIDPRTLSMGMGQLAGRTGGAFATHVLGFDNGIEPNPHLIEDCCESIGATRNGRKLGTLGLASNFSFYYAHHMTTIEGGMICTNDETFYETCRMLRAHGLVRELADKGLRDALAADHKDLDPQFIFTMPSFNCRPTELNAVLGRAQMKRLKDNVEARTDNLLLFLLSLNQDKYRTDYQVEGSSNYALPLVLRDKDNVLQGRVKQCLKDAGVEYRLGTAGGGNQLRQPYMRRLNIAQPEDFPQTEHVHFYGLYCGNYPGLEAWKIDALCERLNAL